jgi:hypothetical protein
VSALPNNAYRVLSPEVSDGGTGPLPLLPSCADDPAPWLTTMAPRPHVSVCANGQALPLMTTPYASGLPSWPLALLHRLHAGDVFAMRRMWLFFAGLSLVLAYRLVRRLLDARAAALVSVATATSAPFLVMNALLLPYETVPCMLVMTALAILSGCPRLWPGAPPDAPDRPGRLVLAAFLVGLAVSANVKALFFVVPLAALAWRSGARLASVRAAHAGAMAVAAALPLAPMAVFAVVDPGSGFAGQVTSRLAILTENLLNGALLREPILLVNFAADVLSHFAMAAEREPVRFGWTQAICAVPVVWCMVSGASWLLGRRLGSVLSAGAGAVLLSFFFVSALLYDQYPGGNYAPLHDVFGIAFAAAALDLAAVVRAPVERLRLGRRWTAAVFVGVLAAAGLTNLARRHASLECLRFAVNATAERVAAAYLRRVGDRDIPLLSPTYNYAGVFESLGHGLLHVVQVQEELDRCDTHGSDAEVRACMVALWRAILVRERAVPLRVVAPVRPAPVDHPAAVVARIGETLAAAAEELGLTFTRERDFGGDGCEPSIVLYRVDGVVRVGTAPAHRPPIPPQAAPPQDSCPGVSPATAQALFEALRDFEGADGCRLEALDTARDRMSLRLRAGDRIVHDVLVVAARACVEAGAGRDRRLVARVPPELERTCPAFVAEARERVGRLR